MKSLYTVVVFLLVSSSNIVSANLVNEDGSYNTDVYGECINVSSLSLILGSQRDAGWTRERMIAKVEKRKDLGDEYRELHFDIIEKLHTAEHADKSASEFQDFMDAECEKSLAEKPKPGFSPSKDECGELIKAAAMIAEIKEKEGSQENTQEALFQHKDLEMVHFEQFNMMFEPEHIDKSAAEYNEYIAGLCAK